MFAMVGLKYDRLAPLMNEKLRRRWAACEAMSMGRGGIVAVSRETGISRTTIRKGIAEIREEMAGLAEHIEDQHIRKPGGGRRRLIESDPTLAKDLRDLLESSTRGDPQSPLQWTCKSVQTITDELTALGHRVSPRTVLRLLHEMDYSLQANRKTLEGSNHPDRNAQFEHINKRVKAFRRRGQPVISVDAKKRELVGNFKHSGQEWRPKGEPRPVNTHDFRDKTLGVAIPYGVYDQKQNDGWVSVGIDHETAAFAIESIRRWWHRMGSRTYTNPKELLITADSGGSNGPRNRSWKVGLQQLADETGLTISVCHFPPGTSKWNKIEHSMFCHIAEQWRAHPLVSMAVVVHLIGSTTTRKGLRVKTEVDPGEYPTGLKVDDETFNAINLHKDRFHGDWNYRLTPR
jgi:hypothetical protein